MMVLLLTTIIIQTGFKSKNKLQQLAEGNVELLSPRKDYSEKKEKNIRKTRNIKCPGENRVNYISHYRKRKTDNT